MTMIVMIVQVTEYFFNIKNNIIHILLICNKKMYIYIILILINRLY